MGGVGGGVRGGMVSHAAVPLRAHLEGAFLGHSAGAEEHQRRSFGSPDAESASCLECHDGVTAPDAGHTTGADHRGRALADGHAVGFPYTGRTTDPEGGALVQPSRIDTRIRFFDRSMGCGSCHSVYSREPNHLVMSNQGSRLCFGCHEM
ncbi:MAG: hypothetical protein CVU59_13510 [Deltaproteobacteria bacterium HGW-Deltaproteobacteria-17]|nr:MAG: hypothetical protein CVU59_13510 [Deltaproteobacteria bacterium HGW-Deltaproteobacteria-17]